MGGNLNEVASQLILTLNRMVKVVRLVGVLEEDKVTSHRSGLRYDRSIHSKAVGSGCMRGNDTYSCNGSASAGIYSVHQEPDHNMESYSEFIAFNYGQINERQYDSSVRKKYKRYLRQE
ncbi:hypothetical protein ACFSRY_01140 [Pontibacter locisalis]|uniref:Uncharacterized protein n=1 Tax=Pontibacter locisalis TaxID=1719035 RepID=A0ABW5IHI3_9BACT